MLSFVVPVSFMAVFVVVALLARLHPILSIVLGVGFLAVPVAQVLTFHRSSFQSEGSAAGLVILLFYALFGVACLSVAMLLLSRGVMRIAGGEQVTPARRRLAIGISGLLVAVGVGVTAYRDYYSPVLKHERVAEPSEDTVPVRSVAIGDAYTLGWERRHGAPALRLLVPAADLPGAQSGVTAIGETRDGPESLQLVLGSAGVRHVKLHRGESFVPMPALAWLHAHIVEADPAVPRALWIDRRHGGWKLLGVDCGTETTARLPALGAGGIRCYEPDAPLARAIPGLFGLERGRLYFGGGRDECLTVFRYERRFVELLDRGRCFEPAHVAALVELANLLDRLGSDTASPPALAIRMERLAAAVGRCEAARSAARGQEAAAHDVVSAACAGALRESRAHLKANPREVAPLMVRALEARYPDSDRGSAEARRNADELLAALAAAGEPRGASAIRAHAIRVNALSGTAGNAAALAESREVMLGEARRLPPADPLLDRIADAVVLMPAEAGEGPWKLAFLQEWLQRASAIPGGEARSRQVRLRLCDARAHANVERETLKGCADEWLETWRALPRPGDPWKEEDIAGKAAHMYIGHAQATGEAAAGIEGLRRVSALSSERLAPSPRLTQFLGWLDEQRRALEPPQRTIR